MKPIIIRNFVDEESISNLNSWTMDNYKKDFFKDPNMGIAGTRMTTRKSFDFEFPKVAYDVKNKIVELLGVDYKTPGFKDGIVNGIGFNGGAIKDHNDPIWHPNTYTLHCNLITQKSEGGGVTIISDQPYETNPRDLLIYKVSHLAHSVSEIKGNIPRILWVFGFSIHNNIKLFQELET